MIENTKQLKHTVDAITVPSGIVAAVGNYIGAINGILTAVVLLTSIGWTVYRIIEIHRRLYPPRKPGEKT